MITDKHLYETTFILNAGLEDPQVEAVINHVLDIITKNGGEVNAVNRWGRKRLTYIIQKKNNGYYVNIEMDAPGSIAKHLEHYYLLEENVIRFLTIRLDKKALKARAMAPPAIPTVETPVVTADVQIIGKEPLFNEEPIA